MTPAAGSPCSISRRDGDGDVALACDVADEKSVVEAVATATDRLSGLDLAFLNAGVGGLAPLLAMSADEWDRTHDVNLRGTFLCLRECLGRWSHPAPAGPS